MSKYIKAGETIHGKSVDLIVRKFVRVGLKKHPITNKTMLLFVSDRNSEGEIKKPINIDDFSSEHLKKMEHYHRNLGDQVECDSLSIYLDSKSRKKIEVIGGHSGRHKAQQMITDKNTFASIKVPLDALLKALESKQQLLNQ